LHPSYPAGHATVAGACSAVLKAFFDESGLITDCVMASADGLSLMPCHGLALLVGGEINKLVLNIAMGRNFAGIHYRSDAEAGFLLGEEVAITMLQDLVHTFNEDFEGFEFTRLDGTPAKISKVGVLQ
jgi:membrane-associated phospholipid phosphatase